MAESSPIEKCDNNKRSFFFPPKVFNRLCWFFVRFEPDGDIPLVREGTANPESREKQCYTPRILVKPLANFCSIFGLLKTLEEQGCIQVLSSATDWLFQS